MSHFSTLLAINVVISAFYSLISKNSNNFDFINSMFTVGMLYFLFGLLCFVYEKGFFNITLYSFNKVSDYFQKKRGVPIEKEASIEDYIGRDNSFFLTDALTWCGALTSIICIIVSFTII